MLLLLDWEVEADNAQRTVALLDRLEYDEEEGEDAGSDTFQGTEAGEAMGAVRSPRMRRSNSLPIVQHRTHSHPQKSMGSLTGSYCRPMNSHL